MVYCVRNDVSAFLQVADFSGSTTPSDGDVDNYIAMSEARIDELTDHAWATARAKEVTDERVRIQKGKRFSFVSNNILGYVQK